MSKFLKLFLIISLGCSSLSAVGQKTDSLFHVNGNILLGEIKKLEYGLLYFSMEGMGTIKVEIEKISTLKSTKFFEFITNQGRNLYGSIDTSNVEGMVRLKLGYDTLQIHIYQLVDVYPIRAKIFKRLSGNINLGFNYTKASNVARYNVDFNVSYRYKKIYLTIASSNIETFNPGDTTPATSKYDLQLSLERKINRTWSMLYYTGINQNTELGLDLRINAGIGASYMIFHTSQSRFSWANSLSPNLEYSKNFEKNTVNLEGKSSLMYEYYKHTTPELYITSHFDFFPSLNIANRYRINYNLDVRIEIVKNLFIGGKLYYNFDNKPVSENAANNDYGFTTTLGYSFN